MGKTGGGKGTNQHQIKGVSTARPTGGHPALGDPPQPAPAWKAAFDQIDDSCYHDNDGSDHTGDAFDAFDAQLIEWFGDDRNGWPDGAEDNLARWMIAYPDVDYGSRVATPADLPVIRLALALGVQSSTDWPAGVLAADAVTGHALASQVPEEELLPVLQLCSVDLRVAAASVVRDPDALNAFARDADWEVRRAAAGNDNLPSAAVALLASDRDVSTQRLAATHPNLPDDAAYRLARDGDREIRLALARNPRLPYSAAIELAYGLDRKVNLVVAANPNLPDDAAFRLAYIIDLPVNRVVAANPNLPAHAAAMLADRNDTRMLETLASRTDWSAETAAELAANVKVNQRLRVGAIRHPGLPAATLASLARTADGSEICLAAVNHPALPAETAAELAADSRIPATVRLAAARHLGLPTGAAAELASNPDVLLRTAVAGNAGLSASSAIGLTGDPAKRVRTAVAENMWARWSATRPVS